MAEYSIGPVEEPAWHIDAEDFAKHLQARWPDARISINTAEADLTILDALIPHEAPQRELGIALHRNGQFISLDPADPGTTAEFAVWLITQIPASDPPIHVINHASWPPLPITQHTTEQQIIDFLEGRTE